MSIQITKNIEGDSKMHDHVTGDFLFCYKILVCGYWDGNNFILVDFSQMINNYLQHRLT